LKQLNNDKSAFFEKLGSNVPVIKQQYLNRLNSSRFFKAITGMSFNQKRLKTPLLNNRDMKYFSKHTIMRTPFFKSLIRISFLESLLVTVIWRSLGCVSPAMIFHLIKQRRVTVNGTVVRYRS